MDELTGLNPRTALAEMDRVGAVVRSRSRWYGRYLVALGAGTIVYYVAVELAGPSPLSPLSVLALVVSWTVFVLVLVDWSRRQPVLSRGLRRLRFGLVSAYFVLVGGTVLASATVFDGEPGRWLLGLAPAVPCFVGGWLVRHR